MPEVEIYITGKELKRAIGVVEDIAKIEGTEQSKLLESDSKVRVKGHINYHHAPDIVRKIIGLWEKERKNRK